MSGEEDEKELELKDLIVQTLEANGLLSKIKVSDLSYFMGNFNKRFSISKLISRLNFVQVYSWHWMRTIRKRM